MTKIGLCIPDSGRDINEHTLGGPDDHMLWLDSFLIRLHFRAHDHHSCQWGEWDTLGRDVLGLHPLRSDSSMCGQKVLATRGVYDTSLGFPS